MIMRRSTHRWLRMANESAAWDPVASLKIQDIALWESSFKRYLEYQPGLHQGNITVLTRRDSRAELLEVEDVAGGKSDVLRALITLGTRGVVLPPGYEPGTELDEDESVLFEVEATFAVSYEVVVEPNEEQLSEFVRFNCAHNVWPFWRQHVYDTLKRASLPLVAVPFFPGKPQVASKPKKKRSGEHGHADKGEPSKLSGQ